MTFNNDILNAAIETARQAANGNRALLNAVEKAAAGLRGTWIVTELHDGLLITSDGGETYRANGTCSCVAYRNGMVCKRRVAYRIVALYHEAEAVKQAAPRPVRVPRITRSIERDFTGARVRAVYMAAVSELEKKYAKKKRSIRSRNRA
jgi:hypothetical protein